MKYIVVFFMILFGFSAYAADITPNGMKQEDLVRFLYELQQNTTYACMNSGALAEGSSGDGAIKITSAINYVANGRFGQIGTYDVKLTASPTTAQATGTTAYYIMSYDPTDGTTEVYQSLADKPLTAATLRVPSGNVIYGYLKIVNTSGGNFTLGTTDLSAAGIADTFYNLCGRPQDITIDPAY